MYNCVVCGVCWRQAGSGDTRGSRHTHLEALDVDYLVEWQARVRPEHRPLVVLAGRRQAELLRDPVHGARQAHSASALRSRKRNIVSNLHLPTSYLQYAMQMVQCLKGDKLRAAMTTAMKNISNGNKSGSFLEAHFFLAFFSGDVTALVERVFDSESGLLP